MPRIVNACLVLFVTASLLRPSDADACDDSQSCTPSGGNLLIGREKQLVATSTCGLANDDEYCIPSKSQSDCTICNSMEPWSVYNEHSHRVENVINPEGRRAPNRLSGGSQLRWWQSENGLNRVNITLKLEAMFQITQIMLQFKTYRPRAMFIERSNDYGKTYRPYRYFADSCRRSFPNIKPFHDAELEAIDDPSYVYCDETQSHMEPSENGMITYALLDTHQSSQNPDPYTKKIQDLVRITNIRFSFTQLHTHGGESEVGHGNYKMYYYAVMDITVVGFCWCYGHSSECVDKNNVYTPGKIDGVCKCGHNTAGDNCERCADFYHEAPWQPSIGNNAFQCMRCNCNDHASKCHHDKELYVKTGSGGVCDDCRDNTAGQHCETCADFYHEIVNTRPRDRNRCERCWCSATGTTNKGNCETRDDPLRDVTAGQCSCKQYVDGSYCDQCKNGYWNLVDTNPHGCDACKCLLIGSLYNQGCNKQSGDCTCKQNVDEASDCHQCRDEFYGLSKENDFGCSDCNCQRGTSMNNQCDKQTGQCECAPGFTGRRCEIPNDRTFCPTLGYISADPEFGKLSGSATILQVIRRKLANDSDIDRSVHDVTGTGAVILYPGDSSVRFSVEVPGDALAGEYEVQMRYKMMPDSWYAITLTTPNSQNCENTDGIVFFSGLRRQDYFETVTASAKACLRPGIHELTLSSGLFGRNSNLHTDRYLSKESYDRHFATHSQEDARQLGTRDNIEIDSITFVPSPKLIRETMEKATVYWPANLIEEFENQNCRQQLISSGTSMNQLCKDLFCGVSSLVTGTVECNCDNSGSLSHTCNQYGGQCSCKPFVIGRKCGRCAPGSYGFHGPGGCTQCKCDETGSLDMKCDVINGQCKCKKGFFGQHCDQCQTGFWNFPVCEACQCNKHAQACDQKTGHCLECRDLTTGPYCDACRPGYYGSPIRDSGHRACKQCMCPGAKNEVYHADGCYLNRNGVNDYICNCQAGYTGGTCNICDLNYFGSPTDQDGACMKCECNDNIDTSRQSCNIATGECTQCLHHSTGPHCDRCVKGFFGDPKIGGNGCIPCVCNTLGSNDPETCNAVTGQCHCKANVVGKMCDRCEKLHYDITHEDGCQTCGCDVSGVMTYYDTTGSEALDLKCDEIDGQCRCKAERGGRTCADCKDLYWGDPSLGCKECDCNARYAAEQQCDRKSGQCKCQDRYGGMKCDECARGFTGQFPNCEPCADCFHDWDGILQKLQNETTDIVKDAEKVQSGGVTSKYDKEFIELDKKIEGAKEQLKAGNDSFQHIQQLQQDANSLKKKFGPLEEKDAKLSKDLAEAESTRDLVDVNVKKRGAELDDLKTKMNTVKERVQDLIEANVDGAFKTVKENKQKSDDLVDKANGFKAEADKADAITRESEDLNRKATAAFTKKYDENRKRLTGAEDKLTALNDRIPGLNKEVCGATTTVEEPCDESCGGAKCGTCGGSGCVDGFKSTSEQVAADSMTLREELAEHQKKANELKEKLTKLLQSAQNVMEKGKKSKTVIDEASRRFKEIKDRLEALRKRITGARENEDRVTPEQIRTSSEEIMQVKIEHPPEGIDDLSSQIMDLVSQQSNTSQSVSKLQKMAKDAQRNANGLKQRADLAKENAEKALKSMNDTVQNIEMAQKLNENSTKLFDQANKTIYEYYDLFGQVESITSDNEESGRKTNTAIAVIADRIEELRKTYVDIDGQYNDFTTNFGTLVDTVKDLQGEQKQVSDNFYELKQRVTSSTTDGANDGTSASVEAQKLKQQASDLFARIKEKKETLNAIGTKVATQAQDINGREKQLEGLKESITRSTQQIKDKRLTTMNCVADS